MIKLTYPDGTIAGPFDSVIEYGTGEHPEYPGACYQCDLAIIPIFPGNAAIIDIYDPQTDAPVIVPRAPFEVQRWAFHIALIDSGLISTVTTALDNIANPTVKEKVKAKWASLPVILRKSSFIDSLQQATGFTDSQIDQLFIAARVEESND